MMKATGSFVLAMLSLATIIGCGGGDGSASLRGSVTYNGEPVSQGSISFMPVGGTGTPFGATIVDGQYLAEKAFAGKFRATVSGDRAIVVPKTREEAAEMEKANQGQAVSTNYIAEDAAGNSQEVDVSGDSQTLDFAITGPPRQ
jgi:hypothetical protein